MIHRKVFRVVVVVSVLCVLSALLAQDRPPAGAQGSRTSEGNIPFRKIEHQAFDVGEELFFDVNYGFITAGTARMAVPRLATIGGRSCYHIEFSVNSKPFFDAFYRVRDRYESFIDVEGLYSWKFVQQIREGGYKRDFSAVFDHARLKAVTTEGEYPIEPFIQDIVSAFYYMRTYNVEGFRPGQKIFLKNFYKDSVYVLTVKYLGKQTIKVEAGTFRCILFEPIMKEGGLFKSSGRIIVWLTDDEKRIPVQVDAEIPIGSITAELTGYKGVKSPIRAKVK
ncbi:MAG: DUF3108 domain-containing protein [Bacteroidota bacterium]|nr:DUF3108 domain-containing protein [Bacteroidota bacterium]